jgi:hypothetical protein
MYVIPFEKKKFDSLPLNFINGSGIHIIPIYVSTENDILRV